ncbi:LON domain serine protease [Ceratobasidium sp. AG-Ba]|nr:LON domain serine protease [Ceratobasidium sp. AG-Ba]
MSGSRSRVDRERVPQTVPRGRDPSPHALNLRSPSPEPTTTSGVAPGHALYDTPPPGEPPVELGPRSRRPPEKYEYYANARSRSRSQSIASRRTRARKARAASFGTAHSSGPDNGDDQVVDDDISAPPSMHNAAPAPQNPPDPAELEPEPSKLQHQRNKNKKARVANPSHPRARPASRGRGGRARIAREHDRSPSPATSDIAPEEEPTTIYFGSTPPGESQFSALYETVDHSEFIKYAKAKLGSPQIEDLQNRGTQNIVEMVRVAEEDSQAKVGSSRSQAKIILFPHSVRTVKGGGWHRRRINETQPSGGPTYQTGPRQSLGDSGNSGRGTKRSRPADDTATESETDDDDAPYPSVGRVAQSQPGAAAHSCPSLISLRSLPIQGTQAPPPTRTGTPATVLESPLHLAQLHDDDVDIPLIPNLQLPVRDTVHARLRARVLERAVNELESGMRRKAEQAKAAEATRASAEGVGGSETGEGWDMMEQDVDELAASNPPRSTPPLPDNTRAHAYPKTPGPPKRTYGRVRTHRAPSTTADYLAEAAAPLPRPSSPSANPAVLFSVERARSVLGRANIERQSRAAIPWTGPRTAAASTCTEAGSALSQRFSSQRRHTNRRLDPVSAARADMVAFNEEVARGNAASFVQSATRANRRESDKGMSARCGPMRNRSVNGLLDDNKEELAQVQAFAEGRFPKFAGTRRRCNRKKKPLARDSTGLACQILVVAKVHLFAYALMEGIYQTRATFLRWAELIHEKTWGLLIQELPYVAATSGELEVLVNYLATLRGKVKERLRPVIAEIHNLQHRIATQQDVQGNLDAFHQAHPNSFHCASMSPRSGHYESPHLGRVIGAGLGHGPTSVIVQFPEYFENMPITVVAFMLALWQFCLEEWSNGYWQSRELGTAHMLDKYEAHLAGLKELRSVAPRRFKWLQDEWSAYIRDYTGASFVCTGNGQAVTDRSELRPDSPVERPSSEQWDELDLELEEERMMRDAQMASIETLEDYYETRQLDDQHITDDVPSRTPSPTPVAEYDSNGRLTARSKGAIIRKANGEKTRWEKFREKNEKAYGGSDYGRWLDKQEWEDAEYMGSGKVSQSSVKDLLATDRYKKNPPRFKTVRKLNSIIETELAEFGGPKFESVDIQLPEANKDRHTLVYRDGKEIGSSLIGSAQLHPHMAFAPVVIIDKDGVRRYDNVHTADFWNLRQRALAPGTTYRAVIFMSDATTLSQHTGDVSAHGIYMSLANIDKSVRAEISSGAWLLIGIIPKSNWNKTLATK